MRKTRVIIWACLAVAAAGIWSMVTHPLGWRFGLGDWPVPQGTPWTYQLESGFIPALTVLSLLGAISGMYHLHNCHQDTCWRLGKHKINGTPWCSRHQHLARPQESVEELLTRLIEVDTEILAELMALRRER